MSLGHHAQAEAQSRWCGASSLRKAFAPRLHGCGAVGNMLQTALQRLQVLCPAPPPTKQFRQQPRLHGQTGILQRNVPKQRSGLSTNVPMSTTGSLPDAPWAPEPSKH